MFIQHDDITTQWIELAQLLKMEWEGHPIDQARARSLAAILMPHSPGLSGTLGHIQKRLATVAA